VQWVHTIWQASSVYNDTHGKSQSLEPTQRANPREIEFVFNPDEHYSDADRVVLCIPEDQPGVVGQCSGRETVPVPHSFQLSKVEAKGKFGLLPFEPVGVYVGSLHPIKGIDVLIEALALHRDQILHHAAGATVHPLKVLVVYERSDTQARHRVQQRLKELDLAQSVVWVEREPSQEWLCYAAADVRIVPSLYEPFGTEVLAALDYGLPIVASNVGGLRFTIAHEETGLLVPPNQPTALAQAIDRVVLDDLWMKRLKRQTTNPSAFAWYRTAAHLSDLYRRLLAGSLSGIMPGRPMVYSLSVPQAGSILSTPQRTEELVQVS
jgi:glycosyltransferase involved in cell wall biosynthesis